MVGMILAIVIESMTEHEYMLVVRRREELVELEKKATLPKHRIMIQEQLKAVRQQLKDAHHERYKRTGQY